MILSLYILCFARVLFLRTRNVTAVKFLQCTSIHKSGLTVYGSAATSVVTYGSTGGAFLTMFAELDAQVQVLDWKDYVYMPPSVWFRIRDALDTLQEC